MGAEADPLIKVGGLADVTGSLPRALRKLSPDKTGGYILDVRLAVPFHHGIHSRQKNPRLATEFSLRRGRGRIHGRAYETEVNGVPVYLIEGPPFIEEMPVYLYDTPLDGDRYTFFSLGALKAVENLKWKPDVVHANDWHTAISLYALRVKKHIMEYFSDNRTILTIHNLPFMGAGSGPALQTYGLPASRADILPKWARHFPLPLGMLTADHITAVSPTYAQEIMTPEFGCGLQDFLLARADRVSGILNGLDMDLWDPTKDLLIPQPFGKDSLAQRHINKIELLKEFNLDLTADVPLLALIGRMDYQKGVDLALESFRQLKDLPWQAIILGTGDPVLQADALKLESGLPDRFRAAIRFDANLARRMYAGADILVMPSRYEPCGLAQMIAMRYGCVPLARATGGLKDSIADIAAGDAATGILFEDAAVPALTTAMARAIMTYANRSLWLKIQQNGMRQDFSWERSAIAYSDLYRQPKKEDR
jgi:starch synthase